MPKLSLSDIKAYVVIDEQSIQFFLQPKGVCLRFRRRFSCVPFFQNEEFCVNIGVRVEDYVFESSRT